MSVPMPISSATRFNAIVSSFRPSPGPSSIRLDPCSTTPEGRVRSIGLRLLADPGVEAPGAAARSGDIEEDEAVEGDRLALVEDRIEAVRCMHQEVTHRAHTRDDEGGRAGEQAQHQQDAADQFDDAGIAA